MLSINYNYNSHFGRKFISKTPYITKSSFVGGHRCPKWLWLKWHQGTPQEKVIPGSMADIGNRIGAFAKDLFPSGISIKAQSETFSEAKNLTLKLIKSDGASIFFEAAFEQNSIRIRTDVLERFSDGTWGVYEVKGTSNVRERNGQIKEKYLYDIGIQWAVLLRLGFEITSAQFIHPNKEYVRGSDGIDVNRLFQRIEVIDEIQGLENKFLDQAGDLLTLMEKKTPPVQEPNKSLCKTTDWGESGCPFWSVCTNDKPEEWVEFLYNARKAQKEKLFAEGKLELKDLDLDDTKGLQQEIMVTVAKSRTEYFSDELADELGKIALPSVHLDFEYLATCGIPLFEGIRPFQLIPFQFSSHVLESNGEIVELGGFLAGGDRDPRLNFATSLIKQMQKSAGPIVAYNAPSAEIRVIKELAEDFPKLAPQLKEIIDRIVDLLPIIRNHVFSPKMLSSLSLASGCYSLKNVTPAFVEGFTYDDLNNVKNGGEAAQAFFQLAVKEFPEGLNEKDVGKALIKYCQRDTEATAKLHRNLLQKVGLI